MPGNMCWESPLAGFTVTTHWYPLQEHAFEEREKYKEGKFILEKAKVMKVEPPDTQILMRVCIAEKSSSDLLRFTS